MFKAIIFDFDGIITDTEPIHMEAWLDVLEPLGLSFDEGEYRAHYLGLNDRDFLDALGHIHHHHFDDVDKSRLIEEKGSACIRLLDQEIPLCEGVADFVEAASKKYLFAICSGATHGEIEFVLRRLKWTELFKPVIAAAAVKRGKPDPEGYIRAIEGLIERSTDIILPENILAIEDSPKGVAAARAAGIKCLAVSSAFSESDLRAANWVASSLAGMDPDHL